MKSLSFAGNRALLGAAIYIHGGAGLVTISNSLFYQNTAEINGGKGEKNHLQIEGGIYIYDRSKVVLRNSNFISNYVGKNPYADNGDSIYVVRSRFHNLCFC